MLARRGYDVVRVDKAQDPRETIGESLLPASWKYFDIRGGSDEIARRFVKKAGGVVIWEAEISQIAFRDFAYDRPGLPVERADLDELLLRNAQPAGVRVDERVWAALIAEARLTPGGVRILRDFSHLSEIVAGLGFVVVADAAGSVDPIFSIGVVVALYSGHLTAWTIDRALQPPELADKSCRLFFASDARTL